MATSVGWQKLGGRFYGARNKSLKSDKGRINLRLIIILIIKVPDQFIGKIKHGDAYDAFETR